MQPVARGLLLLGLLLVFVFLLRLLDLLLWPLQGGCPLQALGAVRRELGRGCNRKSYLPKYR